jgi:hypothetical protein
MKKILSCVIVIALILALFSVVPHADDDRKEIQNVNLSPEGVLTWDPYEGATRYWITFEPQDAFEPEGCSADLYQRARDVNFASGTHSFSLVACNDNWGNLSQIYYGTFEYTAPVGLGKVDNLRWDGKTARWDPVDGAVGYNVYLYNGDVSTNYYYVEETYLDFSNSIALVLGNDYRFAVMAIADGDGANGEMSELSGSTPGWFEYRDIQNVNISEDGILTWDHYEGAERYWLRYGDGACETGDELTVDLNRLFTEYGAESGTYRIDLVACLSNWTDISHHYDGTFDYVKPEVTATPEPQPTAPEIPPEETQTDETAAPATDVPATEAPVTDAPVVTDAPIVIDEPSATDGNGDVNDAATQPSIPVPATAGPSDNDNNTGVKKGVSPALIIVPVVLVLAAAGGIAFAVINAKKK